MLETVSKGFRAAKNRLAGKAEISPELVDESLRDIRVSLLEADPEAMVADKVMPTLPLSVMNVMEGMRGTQEMVVLGESQVNEAATPPLDFAVAGAQVLTITIK